MQNLEFMRKPALLSLMIAVFMTAAVLPGCGVVTKPITQGVVIFIGGKADITRANGTTAALKQADIIAKGDIVKTEVMSYVVIQFGEDIITRIQEDTTVEMKTLFENAQTQLYLQNGQIVSHVKKISKDENFTIETPTAIAAVRGTAYSVSYYPSRSVLAVKDGKVKLTMKDDKAKPKERMVETANTYIISSESSRGINEFESLEIDKLAGVPFSTKDNLTDAAKIAQADDASLSAEIKAKGGPLPKSREDILKNKGFISIVVLYSNRTYTGEIISRGSEIKIRTFDGIVSVPFKQVRNIKRAQ